MCCPSPALTHGEPRWSDGPVCAREYISELGTMPKLNSLQFVEVSVLLLHYLCALRLDEPVHDKNMKTD